MNKEFSHDEILKSILKNPVKWADMFINMRKDYIRLCLLYKKLKTENQELVEVLVDEGKLEQVVLH